MVAVILALLLSLPAFATTNSGVSYQGRILKPDGSPLSGTNAQFKLQIRTPDSAACLMYEEIQSQDLSHSNGAFSLTINDGSGSRTDSTGLTLDKIFANHGSFTLDPTTCSAGTGIYAPNSSDGRDLVVLFKDETMSTWEPIPAQKINFVPFAFEAKQVAGITPASLVRVIESDGTLDSVSPLSNAQYNALVALANGSSTAYTAAGTLGGSALPTMSSGQVLGWNGSAWVSEQIGSTQIANSAVSTSQLSSSLTINTSGTLGAAVTTTRDFKIYAASPSTYAIDMQAPALTASYSLVWPMNAGTNGQVLTTDGSGNLSWGAGGTSSQWTTHGSNISYDGGGNVGIGTSAPSQKLDVNGNISLVNPSAATIFMGTNGVGAPGTAGEKLQLWGTPGTYSAADYGIGITTNNLWFNTNQGFQWDINATPSMVMLNNGNVGIGTTSPTSRLTVAGGDATINTLTVGLGGGQVANNTALGLGALSATATGGENTAVGNGALKNVTSGDSNTAVGSGALTTVSTGVRNTAIGRDAGVGQNGSDSVFIGYNAGELGSGGSNVGIGNTTFSNSNFAGFGNIAIGNGSGTTITTGSYDVLIGQGINPVSATSTGELNIGNLVFGTALGNGATLSTGNVGIGTTAPSARLQLPAGAASAGKAPLKFTGGTLLTTPEDGAMEYDSSSLYYTIGSTRYIVPLNTAAGNFSNVSTISNSAGSITMSPMAGNSVIVNAATVSTSSTTGALIVNGGVGVAGALNTAGNITSGGTITATTSTVTPHLYGSTAASGNILIDGTSNATPGNIYLASLGGLIGVGTTSPQARFDMSANTASGSSTAMQRWTWAGDVNNWGMHLDQVYPGGSIDYAFRTRNGGTTDINALYIRGSGNIGINTASPGARLDVTGSVAASSPGTESEIQLSRPVSSGISYQQTAGFALGTYATNSSGNGYGPASRLDINLGSNNSGSPNSTVMTLQANGNVGIGTTAPAGTLDVEGGTSTTSTGAPITIAAQNAVQSGNSFGGDVTIQSGSGYGLGGSAGNILISSARGTGSNGGNITLSAYSNGNIIFDTSGNHTYTSSGATLYPYRFFELSTSWNGPVIQDFATGNGSNGNYAYFGAVPSAGSYGATLVWGQGTGASSFSERMRMDQNGNVGIGTTSPTQALEVNGKIATTASISGGNSGDVNAGPNGVYSWNGSGRYIRFTTNGAANDFSSQGAPLLINWNTGQNVGIGPTSLSPASTLEVGGSVDVGYSGQAAPTNGLIVKGNVGIATTAPALSLDVKGSAIFRGPTIGGIDGELYYDSATHAYQYYNAGSSSWQALGSGSISYSGTLWSQSGSNVYYTSGYVGVNKSSPGAPLDVNGEIRASNGSTSIGFKAPSSGTSVAYTWPVDGGNGQFLTTNGSGSLGWSGFAAAAPLSFNWVGSNATFGIAAGTAAGQTLRWDGTSTWAPTKLKYTDLVNNSNISPWPASCGAGQAITYSTVTDAFTCVTVVGGSSSGIANGGNSLGSAISIGTDDNYAFNLMSNGSTRLLITAAGNVGVNNFAPGYPLEVSKNATSGYAPGPIQSSGNGSEVGVNLANTSSRSYAVISTGTGSSIGTGKFAITDATASATRLVIDSSGNIGVGTTSPSALLTVNGGALFGTIGSGGATATPLLVSFGNTYGTNTPGSTGNLKWRMFDDGIAANAYGIGMSGNLMEFRSGAGADLGFYTNNGSSVMRLTSGGNVGVGTTSPSAKLTIAPTAALSGATPNANANSVVVDTSGPTAGLSIFTSTTGLGSIYFGRSTDNSAGRVSYDHSVNKLMFSTSENIAQTIDSSGNVGIGTTAPQATLDIQGYARLKPQSAQPAACSATNDGALAMTSQYRLCACKGGSATWVSTVDGSACSW